MMATRVEPPAAQASKPDIALFAQAYFNIELTSQQMEFIAIVATGRDVSTIRVPQRAGLSTANKVILAYLQEGMKSNGRARLPQHPLPPKVKPIKGTTSTARILAAIKRPGGAYNFELSRIALKYTSVISSLRQDGHNIEAQRQYNKKGKATDTWRYVCYE